MRLPDHPAVSSQARGQVRALCAQLQQDATQIVLAAQALPPAMVAAAVARSPTGSRQALRHVISRMPTPAVWQAQRQCAWRFAQPLPGSGDVEIRVVLLNAANRPWISIESFGLRFCRHALGRLIDRSGFAADPVQAMLAAHDALMALHPTDGERLFELSHLPLPAAGGAFLAVRQPMTDGSPMLSCRTWVAGDQMYPDQDRNLAVWQRFLANDAAPDRDYNSLQVKEISA